MAMPRLKMVHKVLLLVAVPLIFQLLFVIVLESQWKDTRVQQWLSNRSTRILLTGHKVLSQLEQTEIRQFYEKSATANAPASAGASSSANERQAKISQGVAELTGIMTGSVRYKDAYTQLTRIEADLNGASTASTGGDTTTSANRMQAARTELKLFLQKFLSTEEASLGPYREISMQDPEQRIHQMLGLALALNIIICCLLIHYFSLNFSSRLRLIVANSELFTQGKPLLPAPPGNDEINELDKVFREMTEAIQKSRQREHQFLGMVSHDLRTPLNTVLATLNSLSEGIYGELNSRGLQRVRQSEVAVERLNKLTADLLNFEKLSSGTVTLELKPVDLQRVLEQAVQSVSGFSEFKNVAITLPATEFWVMADEEKLVQILVNLLSNAIKFSPADSAVSLEVKEFGSGNIEIRVIDRGCGIALEDQPRLFEPFKQGSAGSPPAQNHDEKPEAGKSADNHVGSGLGLSISKTLAEAHYGSIGFESKQGVGTTFYLRLRKAAKTQVSAAQQV
jgi:signal transduction histidine kinase